MTDWHTRSGETEHPEVTIRPVAVLSGHRGGVRSIRFSSRGHLASADGQHIRIWICNSDGIWILQRLLEAPGEMLAYSPDGQLLAFSERFGGAQIWSNAGDLMVEALDPGQQALDVAFSPDRRLLAVADNQGRIRLWDARTYHLHSMIETSSSEEKLSLAFPVYRLSFSPDGNSLACVTRAHESKIQIWSLGKQIQRKWFSDVSRQDEYVSDMTYSPVESKVAVATEQSRCVWIFDGETFSLQGQLTLPELDFIPVALAFSPDGQFLAVAAHNGVIWVWSMVDRRMITAFKAHTGERSNDAFAIGAIAWSLDGKYIATGGMTRFMVSHPKHGRVVGPSDYSVKLWEVDRSE